MKIKEEFYNYILTFIHLLYPTKCVVCSEWLLSLERGVCAQCLAHITPLREPVCKKCSRELPRYGNQTHICSSCQSSRYLFRRCFAVVRYDDITKKIFHAVKFQKRKSYLTIFSSHVEEKLAVVKNELRAYDIVIPVPLDRHREQEREFNQSAVLAKKISNYLTIPLNSSVLKRIKRSIPQSRLARKERLENLKGAFIIKGMKKISGKSILLVDDVFTTGSTVNECAKVLKEAGARQVSVITLARAL
jgi:competence protein ComFC